MSSDKRVFVCTTSELAPGSIKLVERDEGNLAVCNVDGTIHVVDDRCTHGLASLAEGAIVDGEIECPMHFGMFDLKTGKPTAAPCSVPIRVYEVAVEGDRVFAVVG